MIRPVVVYGNPSLRKKSELVQNNYEGLQTLIADMFETMYNAEGVGLAAPQIGVNINLFIIDAREMDENDPTLVDFKKVFINPEIVEEWGDEWTFNEGCLSLPNIREDVKRRPNIKLRYVDENFNQFEESFDGIKARIIQHEYDHLNGVLFVDKLAMLKKRMIKNKLGAIEKGQVETEYRVKFYNH
ncbi:MAG: peptide deformylase [Bacteroidales bacterium]|nr:peptide deformylase [Bacteroidales bacterium]